MNTHKKDQRGVTHNIMLAGIAVLVLGVIGFSGFTVYKKKNSDSAAAAFYYKSGPNQWGDPGIVLYRCALKISATSYRYYGYYTGPKSAQEIFFWNSNGTRFNVLRPSAPGVVNSSTDSFVPYNVPNCNTNATYR